MIIDHIGIACKNIPIAQTQYESLGFRVTRGPVFDKERNLDYLFMSNGGYSIELVAVHDSGIRSDIDTILAQEKKVGNKMYHICYRTENLEREIESYKNQGFKLIKSPSPAVACGGRSVAFMVNVDFGIVEFIQDRKEE